MGLEEDFTQAAADIKPVVGVPTDTMLELYGLYKQATLGDNDTGKPGILDPKGRKKWEAWNSKKGMSKEDAMKAYIELVKAMLEKYAKPEAAPA